MKESVIQVDKFIIPVFSWNTVVVGSGAAGYNAADRLYSYRQQDVAVITEDVNAGTSRNTGSDKQTYYKITLSGSEPDSVREMARTLYEGQCVDGDHALCEAAMSAQSFYRLVELGVPFPRNRYGEYIGYKTDHDPRRRATSAGPYTSKMMTELLQKSVAEKGIHIYNRTQVIKLLVNDGEISGLLCLQLDKLGTDNQYAVFCCKNIIYAVGGPASIYSDSVYPHGHCGASGIAFEAGVKGKNLTEWQYGIASLNPRWNVSGTYMQSLPRFISTDADGSNESEFLQDHFTDDCDMLNMIFLKGYQWPFDVWKVENGSSIIDLLVYRERSAGRRVFLDFRNNPGNKPIQFESLSDELRLYLDKAGACYGTPIERLLHMNSPAVDFFRVNGIDLAIEPLEISLCAQHNNGGLDVDAWWQTNIKGLFAVGEAAATHGVYRPGGSALNAGQVGSTRAAQFIAAHRTGEAPERFKDAAINQIQDAIKILDGIHICTESNVSEVWNRAARRMSLHGGPVRNIEGIKNAAQAAEEELRTFANIVQMKDPGELGVVCKLRDMLLCQSLYLSAMINYVDNSGGSRGSALYLNPDGNHNCVRFPFKLTFTLDDCNHGKVVQEAFFFKDECCFSWRSVRPIPEDDDFFENVWNDFRTHGNIR